MQLMRSEYAESSPQFFSTSKQQLTYTMHTHRSTIRLASFRQPHLAVQHAIAASMLHNF